MAVTSIDRTLLSFEFADGIPRYGQIDHRFWSDKSRGMERTPFSIPVLTSKVDVNWIKHDDEAGLQKHGLVVTFLGGDIGMHGMGEFRRHEVDLTFFGVTKEDVQLNTVLGVVDAVALVDIKNEEGFKSFEETPDGLQKLLVPSGAGEIAVYLNEAPSPQVQITN